MNCALVFIFSRLLTRSQGFAWMMGLMFNLDYFVVGFEFLILTETLTLTLLGLTLLSYRKVVEGKSRAGVGTGILSVWLLLTRPTFLVFFALLVGLTAVVYGRGAGRAEFFRKFARPVILFILINLVGIGAWMVRNKVKYDYWGVSSILPYQLGYYTTSFIEKYQKGSDERLDKYAELLIEEGGRPYNFARRLEEQGVPHREVSRILLKLNLKLIRENFGDYLRLIPGAMADYFEYSWYWTTGHDQRIFARNSLLAAGWTFFFGFYRCLFESPFLLLGVVLIIPVILLVRVRKDRDVFHLLGLLYGAVVYNTLISVLLTNAGVNNLRFRAPVEPFLLLVFYAFFFLAGKDLYRRIRKVVGNRQRRFPAHR